MELFQSLASKSSDLITLFHKVDANNFGGAISFLSFLYLYRCENKEEDIRAAVRLVAEPFDGFDYEPFV